MNLTKSPACSFKWGRGDEGALERLIPLVHRNCIVCAALHGGRARRSQPPGHGARQRGVSPADRRPRRRVAGPAHFLAVAARVMRRILVDHARARRAQKRGGPAMRVTFDEALVVTNEPRRDFVALDDALEALAHSTSEKARSSSCGFSAG